MHVHGMNATAYYMTYMCTRPLRLHSNFGMCA